MIEFGAKGRRGDPLRLSRSEGLTGFIDAGRVEIDSNIAERSIRPIAPSTEKTLFAQSDAPLWAYAPQPLSQEVA